MNALTVKGLCKRYPAFSLENVSFPCRREPSWASSDATERANPPR